MKTFLALLAVGCLAFTVKGAPPGGCVTGDGTHVSEGATVNPTPCEFCTCNNGHLACAIRDCAFPHCQNYITPPGQCCPVCHSIVGV